MYNITRRIKVNDYKPKEYIVYSESEAKAERIEYKAWSECNKGDWGVSDDGYVSECLNVLPTKFTDFMLFPYARAFRGQRLSFIPHWESKNFYSVSAKTWAEMEAKRNRTRHAVALYAQYLNAGIKPDWMKIGRVYRPDQKKPDLTAKRLFKQKEVKQMVDKEMARIFEDRGVSKGSVLDMRLDAIGIAKKKSDPSNMLRGVEGLETLMDMKPSTKTVTDTIQIDRTAEIRDMIAKEESRLTLSREQEVEELPLEVINESEESGS
jgi:hypothetical protein